MEVDKLKNNLQNIALAISPCPNDTFIFENIYNEKVRIENVHFQFHFHDIDVLNKLASEGKYDVIKISFAHFKNVSQHYKILQSGGALGYGVGPLLVKQKNNDEDILMENIVVAIPGEETTAHFLLRHFYPMIKKEQKIVLPFDEIESWTLADKNRLGLLIHEGRFTYEKKGLALVNDLGKLWEEQKQMPIPLGCIIAKKSLGDHLIKEIENAISNSITNYDANGVAIISDFIRQYAQEMEEEVIRKHIDLYVNDFSKSMGDKGKDILKYLEA